MSRTQGNLKNGTKLTGSLGDDDLLEVAGEHGSLLLVVDLLLHRLGAIVNVDLLCFPGGLVNHDTLALGLFQEVVSDLDVFIPRSMLKVEYSYLSSSDSSLAAAPAGCFFLVSILLII